MDEAVPELPSAPPHSAGDTTAALDHDRVAARAYELYLARGASEGDSMEDWLAAERELSRSRHDE
jgi:hypothetical protein